MSEQLTLESSLTGWKEDQIMGPGPCVRTPGADFFEALRPPQDSWLAEVQALLPPGPYWYLCGPMTGYDQLNEPEFARIATILREKAYCIVSPAEFRHEAARQSREQNDVGKHYGAEYDSCLAIDVVVVSHPRCIGLILMPEWYKSNGARIESYIASQLGKDLFEFSEDPLCLTKVNREERLWEYSGAGTDTIAAWAAGED